VVRYLSLKHVYSSPGLYHVHLRYANNVSPLALSIVIIEELLGDLQLIGPTFISFVRWNYFLKFKLMYTYFSTIYLNI